MLASEPTTGEEEEEEEKNSLKPLTYLDASRTSRQRSHKSIERVKTCGCSDSISPNKFARPSICPEFLGYDGGVYGVLLIPPYQLNITPSYHRTVNISQLI